MLPTGTFCTSALLTMDDLVSSSGSSPVSLHYLPIHACSPACYIQPRFHIQCSSFIWPPQPVPQLMSRLLPGASLLIPQPRRHSHSTSKLATQPDLPLHFKLGPGGTTCTPAESSLSTSTQASRPNKPSHPLFFPNLISQY